MYFLGRKGIFCDNYGLYRLTDKRIKCKYCKKYYSLSKLKKDIQVLSYFYLEISARKTARELELDYDTVQSRFMQFRKSIAEYCNKEANYVKEMEFRFNHRNQKHDAHPVLKPQEFQFLKVVKNLRFLRDGVWGSARAVRDLQSLSAIENANAEHSRGLDLRNFQFLMALKNVSFLTCSGSDRTMNGAASSRLPDIKNRATQWIYTTP